MKKGWKNPASLFLGALICLNFLAWIAVYDLSREKFLEVNFFDIGQGDAVFIATPKGQQILIDGGPGSNILEKLGQNMPFWDRSLDLIILTHPETDHFSGLIEVLKRYKVDFILWSGITRDTSEWQEWQKLIEIQKAAGAKVFVAEKGQKIVAQMVYFEILHPEESLEGQLFKNSNDTSVVAKLIYGQNSFLFTGDISKAVENKLLERHLEVDSDVLKVPHHGSKTSSSDDFIKRVLPQIAVISAGRDNSYGHPHQEVLDILLKYGINILRTDQKGDVKIISDGKNFKLTN